MRYILFVLIVSFFVAPKGSLWDGLTGPENKDHSASTTRTDSTIVKEQNTNIYSWLENYDEKNSIYSRIPTPKDHFRFNSSKGSFSNWLRFVELKEGKPKVHLYNGSLKGAQNVHHAVVNMDVGKKDLQQCADAVMRLRAEYLFSVKKYDQIHFKYTSGDNVSFNDWCKGRRPVVKGNKVVFSQGKACQPTYAEFRKYMDNIFNYCGTLSLSKEMKSITLKEIEPGDVFIFGGSPGHAVLVMDVAIHEITGDRQFLIAQSYMPAQEMHVLKNFGNSGLDPWYSIAEIKEELSTPEWTFSKNELKRFQ